MSDNYEYYFPNMTNKRKDLFKKFYQIKIIDDLPITTKNSKVPYFHPIMASYVINDMILECICLNFPADFPKIKDVTDKHPEMIHKTVKVMNNIMNIGKKDGIFRYHKYFGSVLNGKYSGLTNGRYYFLYQYFGTLINNAEYLNFAKMMLDSLLIPIESGGVCIDLNKFFGINDNIKKIWIDEVSDIPHMILNGGMTCLRQLYSSYDILDDKNIKDIIDKFLNGLCFLLKYYDSPEYSISKYSLAPKGILKIVAENKIKSCHISYNYLNYEIPSSKNKNDLNTFLIGSNNVNYINFAYIEPADNVIEICFNKKINKISVSILENCYESASEIKKCNYVLIENNNYNINNNILKININAINAIKYIKPKITVFSKNINNKLYNIYHYNHINSLQYFYGKTNNDIIKTYLTKFKEYTNIWKTQKYITNTKNVCLDEY